MDGGRVVAEHALDAGKGGHSRWLLVALGRLLADAGYGPGDLDALAVNRGPGSFTGIRIGISTAQGLAFGWDKPLLGVHGLEALAWQSVATASGAAPGRPTWVLSMMDARHGNVYAAAYEWPGPGSPATGPRPLARVEPAAWEAGQFLLRVKEALEAAQEGAGGSGGTGRDIVLAGDGGAVYEAMAEEIVGGSLQRGDTLRPVPLDGDRLRAATVARWAALQGPGAATGAVGPLYLKKSEAERKWASRMGR